MAPLPAARAVRTWFSPSTSTTSSSRFGENVLTRSTMTSDWPNCTNVCRAIARHSSRERNGNAARNCDTASRRCAPSTAWNVSPTAVPSARAIGYGTRPTTHRTTMTTVYSRRCAEVRQRHARTPARRFEQPRPERGFGLDGHDQGQRWPRRWAVGAGATSRTASFSVVTTTRSPATAAMRCDIPLGVAMVIAESEDGVHLPTAAFEKPDESLRRRDAGDRHDGIPRRRQHPTRIAAIDPARRREVPAQREHGRLRSVDHTIEQRPGVVGAGTVHDDGLGVAQPAHGRTEPAERQASIAQVGRGHQHQVDVARQRRVLEAVVEHVHRRTEHGLGQSGGRRAHVANQNGRAGQPARQHQRLVAAAIQIGSQVRRVADDHDAVLGPAAMIAAREDGRTLAGIEEQPRHVGHGRRLASSARGEVTDADDGAPASSRLRQRCGGERRKRVRCVDGSIPGGKDVPLRDGPVEERCARWPPACAAGHLDSRRRAPGPPPRAARVPRDRRRAGR